MNNLPINLNWISLVDCNFFIIDLIWVLIPFECYTKSNSHSVASKLHKLIRVGGIQSLHKIEIIKSALGLFRAHDCGLWVIELFFSMNCKFYQNFSIPRINFCMRSLHSNKNSSQTSSMTIACLCTKSLSCFCWGNGTKKEAKERMMSFFKHRAAFFVCVFYVDIEVHICECLMKRPLIFGCYHFVIAFTTLESFLLTSQEIH